MTDIAQRVHSILAERRSQLPAVQTALDQCDQLRQAVRALDDALAQAATARPDSPVLPLLNRLREAAPQQALLDAEAELAAVRTRFQRPTLNVGVSGQARVGKSTLLQTISGLGDDQIPTGNNLPVTAVRSRIVNVAGEGRALVTFHSFESFRDEVLEPTHAALGLGAAPRIADAFRAASYATPEGASDLDKALYSRVRKAQGAFGRFAQFLTGEERIIPLAELRPFVAYPKHDDDSADRRYLAVRDVVIEQPFPSTDVRQLALVDLPGLGEVSATAEAHHVEGLKNEVDVVALLKRPVTGMGFWKDEDIRTLGVLDQARGAVDRRDFVFLLVNDGGVAAEQTEALLSHIQSEANEGQPDKNYRVLQTDASDSERVREGAVGPLLGHLAEHLPGMDAAVLARAKETARHAFARVRSVIEAVEAGVAGMSVSSPTAQVVQATDRLREAVAVALNGITEDRRSLVQDVSDDAAFEALAQNVEDEIGAWIDGGLGDTSVDAWTARAVDAMKLARGSSGFAEDELNRIRVHISEAFGQVDVYLHDRVAALHTDVAKALHQRLNSLVPSTDRSGLERLAGLLRDAQDPAPHLAAAIDTLLALGLDYRSHFHPRVRVAMMVLEPQVEVVDPDTGTTRIEPSVPLAAPDENGAEDVFHGIKHLARQASFRAKQALLRESRFVAQALFAAAEQFEDSFVRSGTAQREFLHLGLSYRDDVWPGVYSEREAHSAQLAAVRRSLREVREVLPTA